MFFLIYIYNSKSHKAKCMVRILAMKKKKTDCILKRNKLMEEATLEIFRNLNLTIHYHRACYNFFENRNRF